MTVKKNYLAALLVMACCFAGFGEAPQALVTKAESGSVAAQMELAQYYLDEYNEAEAAEWYEKAAEKGNVEAMVACAELWCNLDNFYMEPDYVRGIKWYRKAASKGNSKAKAFLAEFAQAEEIEYDDCPYTWLPWFSELEEYAFLIENIATIRKSYAGGNPVAAYYLALISFVDEDFPMMVKYLKEALPKVDDDNAIIEGIFPHDDNSGHPIEYVVPVKVYSFMGYCYEHGLGVTQDYAKAAECYLFDFDYSAFSMSRIPRVRGAYCYKKAGLIDKFINQVNTQKISFYNSGNPSIEFFVPCLKLELGKMYEYGEKVPQNKKTALSLYEAVVDQRSLSEEGLVWITPEYGSYYHIGKAAYRAAKMYRNGEGCKADEEMAELYLNIALKFGDNDAWYENNHK